MARRDDLRGEAAGLAELHACRSRRDLEARMQHELACLWPGVPMAICLADDTGTLRASVVVGDAGGPAAGDEVAERGPAWSNDALPIRYRSHDLGTLFVATRFGAADRAIAGTALAHFGIALANLTLGEESRRATSSYCASLQALEEGIVLFQEQDAEAVLARLLHLATTMAGSTAGALYVLREVGDPASGLRFEQALGIPDAVVESFRSADGSAWPDVLLGRPAQLHEPKPDGSLALLAPDSVPAVLSNLVVLPLRYHGVEAGLCLLFNAGFEPSSANEHLSRVQSLGQLGAALLHRLRLEALHARNSTRERELQIAETLQKRLLPTAAPATPAFTFAWDSIAAERIGGDYLDAFCADGPRVHAIIADASGHGISSALLTTSFRANYRANAGRRPLAELARALNDEIVNEVGATGMFITAALLEIDAGTRHFRIASAGHIPVLLHRARTGTIERLESDGPPFGFLHGAVFATKERALEAGDLLLLCTDGVTEAADADLRMFGEERLEALLREHADDEPAAIVRAVDDALARFTRRTHLDDDVSLLVIRAR